MSELPVPEDVQNFCLEEYADFYRVVAFGDSITASVRQPKEERWTTLLQNMIAEAMPDKNVIVVNAGIGATTSRQGLERVQRDVVPLKPHLVTICFALNDGGVIGLKQDGSYVTKLTIEESRQCLREMIDVIRNQTEAKVILWTPNKIGDLYQSNVPGGKVTAAMRREVCAVYNRIVKEVASEKKVAFVDIHGRFEKEQDMNRLLHPDGVHPNKYGDLIIAEEMFKAWKLLEKKGDCNDVTDRRGAS